MQQLSQIGGILVFESQTLLNLWAQDLEQNSRPLISKALVWVMNIPQLSHLIICAGSVLRVAVRDPPPEAEDRSRLTKRMTTYASTQ